MSPDEELMVIFGALHLVALVLGGVLFVMFLRSEAGSGRRPPEDDDGGGGGNDRLSPGPTGSPPGGLPPPPPARPARPRAASRSRTRCSRRCGCAVPAG